MSLFEAHGNTEIEGVTCLNACYGGTEALFSTLSWMESSAWDGRLGLVVTTDIAVYEKGPARPTGGAGAVAMLISPDAIFVVNPIRSTHMKNSYDFFKPNPASEYPTVIGRDSIQFFLGALETNYSRLKQKMPGFSIEEVAGACFHTPFCKMVEKSIERIVQQDLYAFIHWSFSLFRRKREIHSCLLGEIGKQMRNTQQSSKGNQWN